MASVVVASSTRPVTLVVAVRAFRAASRPAGVTARAVSVPEMASAVVANSTRPVTASVAVRAFRAASSPAGVTMRWVSVPAMASAVVASSALPASVSVAWFTGLQSTFMNFSQTVPLQMQMASWPAPSESSTTTATPEANPVVSMAARAVMSATGSIQEDGP